VCGKNLLLLSFEQQQLFAWLRVFFFAVVCSSTSSAFYLNISSALMPSDELVDEGDAVITAV
jgi:hypothetical protein